MAERRKGGRLLERCQEDHGRIMRSGTDLDERQWGSNSQFIGRRLEYETPEGLVFWVTRVYCLAKNSLEICRAQQTSGPQSNQKHRLEATGLSYRKQPSTPRPDFSHFVCGAQLELLSSPFSTFCRTSAQ